MGFPSKKELEKIREMAEKIEPDFVLGPQASQKDKIKYHLCQAFVFYIVENGISQTELARELEIPQPRANEIVKCKIHLFTIDRLVEYYSKLFPDVELEFKEVS